MWHFKATAILLYHDVMDLEFAQGLVDSPAPSSIRMDHLEVLIWQLNWSEEFKMASLTHLGPWKEWLEIWTQLGSFPIPCNFRASTHGLSNRVIQLLNQLLRFQEWI